MTDALVGLDDADWRATWENLRELRLVELDRGVDAHPLLREFYAEKLKGTEAGTAGHLRLYEHLTKTTEDQPETLEGLEPLYQAVVHGCRAGRVQEALMEVYYRRISREGAFYATSQLGGYGVDLTALAAFFVEPWGRPHEGLPAGHQAFVVATAGFNLRALGRLADAREATSAALERRVAIEDWQNAARVAGNLSELELATGNIANSIVAAGRAVELADRSGDAFRRMLMRTKLAGSVTNAGRDEEPRRAFAEAERMQAGRQPEYPLLYSLQGFLYCDALLMPSERAAWGRRTRHSALAEVRQRAATTLAWVGPARLAVLDVARDHLTLARCGLYAHLLNGEPVTSDPADTALLWLRRAATDHLLPLALLTHAWTHHVLGAPATALADLDESEDLCERAGLRLHLADTWLYRARLFHDRAALEKARTLILECGYGRLLPELADADEAAKEWR